MEKESTFTKVAIWLIVAFVFGASFTIGIKVVNSLWPDAEKQIVIKHVYEEGK